MAIGKKRGVTVEIRAESRRMDRELRETKKKLQKFKKDAGKAINSGVSTLVGFGSMALGGLALGSAASEALEFEKSMARLQESASKSGSQMGEFRTAIMRVSRDSGIARQSLIEGAASYVAMTGDANNATRAMELFAKTSNATGASMDDIAGSIAVLRDGLVIKDFADLEAALSTLHLQGKMGSVEFKQMAQYASDLAPAWRQFEGGTGVEGLRKMGAVLQAVSSGGLGAAKAVTSINQMADAFDRHAKKFEGAGINIFDPKSGKKREMMAIIDDIAKKGMRTAKLIDLFGSTDAMRGYQQAIANRRLIDDAIAQTKDKMALDRAAADYQQNAAAKMEKAFNAVKLAAAEAFTPERIEAFAKAVEGAAWVVAKMVETIEGAGLLLQGINTPEKYQAHMEQKAWESQRGARITQMMASGKSRDEALFWVAQEDGARGDIRRGKHDRRGFQWMEEQRQRFAGATNADEIARAIDTAEARMMKGSGAVGMIARAVELGMARATVSASLKVGADPVAKATTNAPAHRTRPGGL